MEKGHIRALGLIAIIYSILVLIYFFVIYGTGFVSMGFQKATEMGMIATIPMVIPTLIVALMYLVGGIAFFKYKNWGRIILIIASFINLLSIPIGTILGIMFLIYLFKKDTKALMN